MGLELTKQEAEEQGKCAGCISFYPNNPIIPPFTTHCLATNTVYNYIWCPKRKNVEPKINR